MKPASFAYHAPREISEAVALLAEHHEDGRILAGGQSLVPAMAFRLARPSHLVDINRVAELDFLRSEAGVLRIGALTRHAAFHRPVSAPPMGDLLAFVARHIAHFPIRTRGTFCGSLAHADPASEWCLVAATLGAEMLARSVQGERRIKVAEFFEWIMTTTLREDEILVEARLPLLSASTRWGFNEFSRRAGDYALAMSLVTFELKDGIIADPRLGVGGAEGRARRLPSAEAVLLGQAPTRELFRTAAEAAAAEVDPLKDVQADAEFRRDLVRAVVRRALDMAAA